MNRTKKIVCILLALSLCIGIAGKHIPGNAVYAQELPKDGTYSIPVHLWNATKDAASLGNDALEQVAKLVIDKGECKLYIKLNGISMMGLQGYLMQLDVLKNIQTNENGYPIQYEYKDTTVVSRYAVVDLYNSQESTDEICRGKYYPKVAAVDVTYGETYTWAHIYVPVMGSMGFGDQICRIKLDYDQIREMTQQEEEVWKDAQKDEVTTEVTPSPTTDVTTSTSPDTTKSPAPEETPKSTTDVSPSPKADQDKVTPSPTAQGTTATPVPSENVSVLDKDNLANGTYSLNVSLWKEAVDELSMGNPALQSMALLTVKDGTMRLQIGTRLMTLGTVTAGLHSFQVQQKDGSYLYADIDASENILDGEAIPSLFSFILPDTSDYLAVKIDPRVAIMNNQVMDARLKLDWSTLSKVAQDTQIKKEEPVQSQTTAKAYYQKDKKTGIIVCAQENVLAESTVLKSAKLTQKELKKKKSLQKAVSKLKSRYQVYQVGLQTKAGKTVQPNGIVTISIPIPAAYRKAKVKCYRIQGSNLVPVTGKTENGRFLFQTSSMGNFALTDGVSSKTTTKKTSSTKKATTSTAKKKASTTARDLLTSSAFKDTVSDSDNEQDEDIVSDDETVTGTNEEGASNAELADSETVSDSGAALDNETEETNGLDTAGNGTDQNAADSASSQDRADQKAEQRMLHAICLGGSMLLSVINVFFVCGCILIRFYKKRKEED